MKLPQKGFLLCSDKMGFLVKEYNIPFVGKVEFIEAQGYEKKFALDKTPRYFANNENIGHFCKECASVEELAEKVMIYLQGYFEGWKKINGKEIEERKSEIGELENILEEINHNENPKEHLIWLAQYQTDNELQLEYQERAKQKTNHTLQTQSEGGN